MARRGHCLEFFPEGGRSRTGRLMPAKFGLLKMCVDSQRRGLPKPLAFVPVYFGYEIVLEGSSYLSELRGANKKKENIFDILRSLKLIRKNFGEMHVNFGTPIQLDDWLTEHPEMATDETQTLQSLGRDLMLAINRQATANPINLVASVILTANNQVMAEQQMLNQLRCHQQLINDLGAAAHLTNPTTQPSQIVEIAEDLGWLDRESHAYGDLLALKSINAVMLTWYRNNILHLLALPSLIACLLVNRRRGVKTGQLQQSIALIFPYIAQELSAWVPGTTDSVLDSMARLDLIRREDDVILPATQQSEHRMQLVLLSKLVNETLERMYIVLSLAHHGRFTRDALCQESQLAAKQMARLHGLNAPEFFDQGLFDQFVDRLLTNRHLEIDPDGILQTNATIAETLHLARTVINDNVRFTLNPIVHNQS